MGLRSRLFIGSSALVVVLGIAGGALVENLATRRAEEQVARELEVVALTASLLMDDADPVRAYEVAQAVQARVTLIADDGTVLADSYADAAHMEDHSTRPEVLLARSEGLGLSRRRSATTGQDFLYVAVPSALGTVRVARPLPEVDASLLELRLLILALVLASILGSVGTLWLSNHLFGRALQRLVDSAKAVAEGSEERAVSPEDELFGSLAGSLNQLAEDLALLIRTLGEERMKLRQLEVVRSDFVANVSHELRTPLAVIRANSESLLDGGLEEAAIAREFTEAIHRQAERLNALFDDLQELVRIESGHAELELGPVELDEVCESTADSVHIAARRKRIELVVEADEGLVLGDASALQAVLINLVDNAIKYSPPGTRVWLRARGGRIEVEDQGPGIAEDHRDRVFERFYRVDVGRSRKLGGTGLGLSIVRNLVAAMKGRVWVEDGAAGARFVVELPQPEA